MNCHLIIMAKVPRIGLVKTRLAADVGLLEATRIYRCMLMGIMREVGDDSRWQTHLALAPEHFFRNCKPSHAKDLNIIAQTRGDLGARMSALLRRFSRTDRVIIGSDIPEIRRRHIVDAFRSLGNRDAVFGPAQDGGYWLVGVPRRHTCTDIFENVRWSTPHALEDTLANLRGRKVGLLETLRDVDKVADLIRHGANVPLSAA